MPSVSEEPAAREIPGAELPAPPQPLLPSSASAHVYLYDIMVRKQIWNSTYDDNMAFLFCAHARRQKDVEYLNGQERTITHFRDLLHRAGWKLTAVHFDSLSVRRYQKVVAVPT